MYSRYSKQSLENLFDLQDSLVIFIACNILLQKNTLSIIGTSFEYCSCYTNKETILRNILESKGIIDELHFFQHQL